MEPLISVIIPVYNVEKYIDRCIVSVVEQTYKNLEIVLVDDGTPDNSGIICDEWAEKDDRIVVYHKQNGGLSDARNFGTARANGEFITYVDSDDYVLPEYVEHMYSNLVENEADISCCDFENVYSDDRKIKFDKNENLDKVSKVSGKSACQDLLTSISGFYYVVAWGKLYKRNLLEMYQYPVGRYHEDEATTYKYLYSSEFVVSSCKKLYAYFQNQQGIMHNKNRKRRDDIVWALNERTNFFRQQNDRTMEIAAWDGLVSFYIYEEYDELKRFSKDAYIFAKQHWFNGDLSLKAKFKFILYAISPHIYRKVINVLFE